ncbi:MAG TPA: transcription antitermination protein NusB [Leptolyngbyaceae cyanobacterium M33_DOE_097]|uniref:Transcription antitermination protein NusB n=1 Tax=Oscillatoriales cyanobacterium SpSt-418 TaxID=2282169 RepID=A0A7C3PA70_9CYAN|nr:transcription antitermination protein NusB [Leptolyngbyaceae cyanobacterium M33_DOE_097]
MQPRRIARELALLSASQLPNKPERLQEKDLQAIVVTAIRTLSSEANEALESAAAELQQSNSRLLNSETRASDVEASRSMVESAIALAQTAINRVGMALEVPEFIQLSNQHDVRDYALQLVTVLKEESKRIDEVLSESLVDWQLSRLAAVDRNILRIATAEMMFLRVDHRIAIDEAVELAKRYSDEESHRFINGVLRRVFEQLRARKD